MKEKNHLSLNDLKIILDEYINYLHDDKNEMPKLKRFPEHKKALDATFNEYLTKLYEPYYVNLKKFRNDIRGLYIDWDFSIDDNNDAEEVVNIDANNNKLDLKIRKIVDHLINGEARYSELLEGLCHKLVARLLISTLIFTCENEDIINLFDFDNDELMEDNKEIASFGSSNKYSSDGNAIEIIATLVYKAASKIETKYPIHIISYTDNINLYIDIIKTGKNYYDFIIRSINQLGNIKFIAKTANKILINDFNKIDDYMYKGSYSGKLKKGENIYIAINH